MNRASLLVTTCACLVQGTAYQTEIKLSSYELNQYLSQRHGKHRS